MLKARYGTLWAQLLDHVIKMEDINGAIRTNLTDM